MCIDMCTGICVDMRIYAWISTCIEMDTRTDMSIEIGVAVAHGDVKCRCVHRHTSRHALTRASACDQRDICIGICLVMFVDICIEFG